MSSSTDEMRVTKRNSDQIENVSFDKILTRLKKLGQEANLKLNYTTISMKVIDQLYDLISTTKIDELSAEQCASLASLHPDYNTLAGRIVVSNHHKNTSASFSEVMTQLYWFKDKHNKHSPMVSHELFEFVSNNAQELDTLCDYSRDYLIDYFGFKTLDKSYLSKINRKTVERPQHMWLRVSIGIHGNNMAKIAETYKLMSLKYFTHATPTLFNAGTMHPQLSSCYLISMESDSIEGIYNTLKDCALISKWAGGIGMHIHNVRASGSHIRGTNGQSNGIVPMLRVFNNTAKYVDQCVVGETRVLTPNGYVRIDQLVAGESEVANFHVSETMQFGKQAFQLANEFRETTDEQIIPVCPEHTGYDRVKTVVEHIYKGPIMYIRTIQTVLYITPQHPILTISKHDVDTCLSHPADKQLEFAKWVDAAEIQEGDYVVAGPMEAYMVCEVGQQEYSGKLYDLEMETYPNYTTETAVLHNGGGRRNGSFAIYLEPWHADVELFLQMRKNHGDEELKARDLFYAIWISDLFMERVKIGGTWTLMCPDECPGLSDVYGDEFVQLYESYESAGKGRKTIPARELWFQILDAQMETGTPYLLFKDAANRKSNQKNIGTIKSSNLCTEIMEVSTPDETAVCNLASIALPTFVDPIKQYFDYEKLHEVAKVVTYNLNRVIDINFYPTEKTRLSNLRHRPIGIGVQGLADTFILLNQPFTSDVSKIVNKRIFETIYHAAVEQSMELAMEYGPYDTFVGSPASNGILQFNMWGVDESDLMYNWSELKEKVRKYGMRNSLLVAPMPTASTSQILGFNECFEPITSNIYSRRTLAGEFILANKYLMNDLLALGLWNEKVKNNIIANNGSVQHIDMIPENIREKYKTVWEIPMRDIIDMSADRGAFVCQSQSLNLWLEDPNYNTLTSMHFYSWKKGLKTGMYYLRRRGKHQAQQFTIEPDKKETLTHNEEDEICEMCSA